MVGGIEDGVLIGEPAVIDPQLIVRCQGKGNGNLHVARESHVHILFVIGKGNGVILHIRHIPDAHTQRMRTAVEVVLPVVFVQRICFSVQGKSGVADPVSVRSDAAAEVEIVVEIALQLLISQDNVLCIAVLIRNGQGEKIRPVIHESCTDTAGSGNLIGVDFLVFSGGTP